MSICPSPTRGRILVTGAAGFVGRAVVDRLCRDGHEVVASVREQAQVSGSDASPWTGRVTPVVADLTQLAATPRHFAAVHTIVHCAARVHQVRDTAADPLAAFRAVNRDATLAIARAAIAGGVRRFVFVSTAKVYGEEGCFAEHDEPAPADPYAMSKYEAEEGLRALAAGGALDLVIVRPPLVYGPGVRANFAQLASFVARGIPLPLAHAHNRRSIVALANLVDFLATVATHAERIDDTFVVTDGSDVSVAELVTLLADVMDRPLRLLPIPPFILRTAARLVGREALVSRLFGTLRVDMHRASRTLGWMPPVDLRTGLQQAVGGAAT